MPGNQPIRYPQEVRDDWGEAVVHFEAEVTVDGRVESVKIEDEQHVPRLANTVRQAVSTWRFDPARDNGQPVRDVFRQNVEFTLDGALPYGRMYATPSRPAWEAVKQIARDLGLKADNQADADQLLLTKFTSMTDRAARSLGAVKMPPAYRAVDFQLEVFVSPFAEPARVYVASIVRAVPVGLGFAGPRPSGAIIYNVGEVHDWFINLVDRRLGPSHPIPTSRRKRRQLARQLGFTDSHSPCASEALDWAGESLLFAPEADPASGQAIPTPIIKPEPKFPDDELRREAQADVEVKGVVLEDGSVFSYEIAGGKQAAFSSSATNALSLWRFAPAQANGCPTSAIVTLKVGYRLRR